MKFRAVRPSEAGATDVTIVPFFADKQVAKSLPRGKRAIAERLGAEHGSALLYNVLTHAGGDKDGRVVIVRAGKRAGHDAERARNTPTAGIKSLWNTDTRPVAIS